MMKKHTVTESTDAISTHHNAIAPAPGGATATTAAFSPIVNEKIKEDATARLTVPALGQFFFNHLKQSRVQALDDQTKIYAARAANVHVSARCGMGDCPVLCS